MALLTDRVAIVSGIGPGMGRDIALALAREGAHVVLAARRPESLAAVAAEVEALGVRALQVPTNIAKPEQAQALAQAASDEFGRIDVLVNNAFRMGHDHHLATTDLETWRKVMDVNLWGSLAVTQAVLPHMRAAGRGSVVMINTMSIRIIEAGAGSYAASKAALLAAAQTLAREEGRHGVRVNTVLPGYIWGDSVEWFFEQQAKERGVTAAEVYAEVASNIALGRIVDSAEIADAVLFFASDLSRAVTGQTLDVNGGHHLG